MKQLLLTLFITLTTILVNAQVSNVYVLNDNGLVGTSITVSEDVSGVTVDLALNSFSEKEALFDGKPASAILLEDGISVMEQGVPDIQYLSASIAIPYTGSTVVVTNASEYTDYPSFNIAPSVGDPGIYGFNSAISINSAIYNTNSFYPSEVAIADEPYIFGNTRGQSVYFYPVQYNPVTGTLRVYHHINITLQVNNNQGKNELVRFSPLMSTAQNNIAGGHFLNSKTESSSRYTTIEEQGNMLIIAHPDFIAQMHDFIEWKNQKGIRCELVDVTSIGDAQKIREFVSDYYYSKGLTYLLLVGDEAFVPSNVAEKGLSDNVYGYLSGDDHYPEVMVGRFSCETADQCRLMAERTISYEKEPSMSPEYSSFLGIGSGLGPGDDNELDFEHIRNVSNAVSSTYSNIMEMYDGSRGGKDANGDPVASMVSDALNKGTGAVMYLGHGSVGSWVTSNFSGSEVRKLNNTEVFPVIWSAGCDNGDFKGATCFAEFLLRAENNGKPTGAVAALMSTANQNWYPPMEAQDEMGLILSGNHETNKSTTFGGISLSGCMKMNEKYGFGAYTVTDNWTIFGDPSIEIRTTTPVSLNPVHKGMLGTDAVSFTISNLPVNSQASLSMGGVLITTALAASDQLTLDLPSLAGVSKLTLVISGQNIKPYITEIAVTDQPAMATAILPQNHSNKVSVQTAFAWNLSEGVIPDTYKFCIRKQGAVTWEEQLITDASQISLTPLAYLTSYEWKVISIAGLNTSESAVFSFSTIDRPDEDFEQEGFPRTNWVNTHEWYVDNSEAFEGYFSLHSGSTESRSTTSLFYECTTTTCDYISFELKLIAQSEGAALSFFVDNFPVAEWDYTMNWTNITYQIEPGNHVFEWRFTSGDSLGNNSAAWLDNIYLPVNEAVNVNELTKTICPSNAVKLEAVVANHASLTWRTEGKGYFDDPSKMDAVYYPSAEELLTDKINLYLDVTANSTCGAERYDYEISLDQLPEIPEINDTTIYLNESFTVPAPEKHAAFFILYGNDTTPASPVIDAARLSPGSNLITVISENSLGCGTVKQFNINVIGSPRPETSVLTVYPNPSVDIITINNPVAEGTSTLSIFSLEGQLIEQHVLQGTSTGTLEVSHLEPGLYIVRAESNGKSVTGKFIKI